MKNFDIIGIGESIVDIIETKKAPIKNPGGAPLNVIATCSKLGLSTAYISSVGDDDEGKIIKDCFKNFDIDNSFLETNPDISTCTAIIKLDKRKNRSFVFKKNNGSFLTLSERKPNIECKCFVCGTLCMFNETSRKQVEDYILYCKNNNILIAFDANYRETEMPLFMYINIVKHILKYVDILKISIEEARILSRLEDINDIKNYFMENFDIEVLLSLGSKGAIAINKKNSFYRKAKRVNPVDTTGAGDILFGTYLSSLIVNGYSKANKNVTPSIYIDSLKKAVRYATESTKRYGAASSIIAIKKTLI